MRELMKVRENINCLVLESSAPNATTLKNNIFKNQ